MITYQSQLSLSPGGACNAVLNPNNNTLVILTANYVYTASLSTLTILSSAAAPFSIGPTNITLINSSSAIITGQSSGNQAFFELSSGYTQLVAGGDNSISPLICNQILAGDPSTNIAFGCTPANHNLNRINGNNFTASQINLLYSTTEINCIINIGPGRWICGDDNSQLYEIDQNGTVLDTFDLYGKAFPLSQTGLGNTASPWAVYALAYTNNMLLALTGNTSSIAILMDWSTKTILKVQDWYTVAGQGIVLSTPASGEILSFPQGPYNVCELDMTINPLALRDMLLLNNNTSPAACGVNSAGQGWAVTQGSSNAITFFTVTPRPFTSRTFSAANSNIMNPTNRLLLVDNTSGTGTATVLLDTTMNSSSATYLVPTGKNIYELVKIGTGVDATWDMSNYNT